MVTVGCHSRVTTLSRERLSSSAEAFHELPRLPLGDEIQVGGEALGEEVEAADGLRGAAEGGEGADEDAEAGLVRRLRFQHLLRVGERRLWMVAAHGGFGQARQSGEVLLAQALPRAERP